MRKKRTPASKSVRARPKKTARQFSPLAKQLVLGGLLLSTCALLTYGVYKVTRIERFLVASVVVSGGETISHEEVAAVTESKLLGDYYALVPRRFMYAVPKAAIVESVKALPRVKDARITVEDNEVMIAVTEYEPYAIVCHEACLLVDRDGVAFAAAPELKGRSLLRVEVPEAFPLYAQPVGREELLMLNELRAGLHEFQSWGMSRVRIEATDTVELWFDESKVLVTKYDNAPLILKRLAQILENETFAHLSPGNFVYIDMRYGNKVFVKEVGAETSLTSGELETEVSTATEG